MKSILITSSILIVLIAALRPLLRGKIDPRVLYALWLAAALRLLVPVNLVTSAYSALALADRAEEKTHLAQAIGQAYVPIVPVPSYEDAYLLAVREYDSTLNPHAVLDDWYIADFSPEEQAMLSARARELQAKGPTLTQLAEQYAKPIWLAGAAAMGLWFLLVNLRLRRRLRCALPVEADCPLPVRVTPELLSPCLCGVFRPAVYVTPEALADPDRMRHVLAHELTHYRHRDNWWTWVRCLCLCLYWFDPLVWWAAALSRQDCELACDEGAIRRLGEPERIPYGRTLVAMIAAGRNPLLQTATTMTGGKRRVQERIKLIARRPKTVMAAALALVLIVGCAVGCTFTGAPEDSAEPAPSTQPTQPDAAPLDAPRLPLSTLRERLLDVPEELRSTVTASASETKPGINDIPLVTYWWDVPAEWESERLPWLLDVHRWERAGIEAYGWPAASDNCVADLIAQDEEFYYVIERPMDTRFQMEDSEPFTAAYLAIRGFAEKTVLETQGVEPYPSLLLDALRERLNDIPEELREDVEAGSIARNDTSILAAYWLSGSQYQGDGAGWLLNVERWDQAWFEHYLYSTATGNYEVFARDSKYYYAFTRATDARYELEDAERYAAAFRAIREYAEQQVLNTEGVEPFDGDALRGQEYLQVDKRYTDVLYYPYRAVNGSTAVKWIFRLVQPAVQGPGGVWIPERVEYYDEAGPLLNIEHIKPDTGGLTVAEYAKRLQAEADAGDADWAVTPIGALSVFIPQLYGHDISYDSFLNMPDVIENTREGAKPTQAQQIVQEAVDTLMGSSHVDISLSIDSQGVGYGYGFYDVYPDRDPYAVYLENLAARFTWEEFDWGTTEEPRFPTPPQDSASLRLGNIPTPSGAPYPANFAWLTLWDTGLVSVHDDVNGTHWYYAHGAYSHDEALTPYEYLRSWYDTLEISTMRPVPIPNQGQSHEEIARAWAENWEGAMAKTSPGSTYACTYVRVEDVKADCHSFMTEEDMDEFARSRDRVGADYGKTWFSFTYNTVFVPEEINTKLWAGNTWYYEGDDAPEGALIYMRVAYMDLTDEGWVCHGTGTGW